jgi:hypothetical protein
MAARKGHLAMVLEAMNKNEQIYHYSTAQFARLETPRHRGTSNDKIKKSEEMAKKYNLVGPYCDHISFFFDPIPLDLLGKLYGKDHGAWVSGNKLYEHVVHVRGLPEIPFEVVETATDLEIMDSIEWEEEGDNSANTSQFFKRQRRAKLLNGEIGSSNLQLLKQIERYKGGTRDAYLAASKRDDFEFNFAKYASCVPHLMIYPPDGYLEVNSSKLVTIK